METKKTDNIYRISNLYDIEFKIFDEAEDKSAYSIGDLLNMPYFFAGWSNTPHGNDYVWSEFKKRSEQFQGSIFNIYDTARIDPDEPIPNIQRIRDSVDQYIENNRDSENLNRLFAICADEKTLVVHLRAGDKGIVEDEYIQKINDLSDKYDTVLILCGVHKNGDSVLPGISDSIAYLKISLEKLSNNSKVLIDVSYPDEHLCAMRRAKNLLVHKGGFSVLGSIIFTGNNLYITNLASPIHHTAQYNTSNNGYFDIIPPCIMI